MSFVKSNVPFFGPRQVPGLALWLDASDATTVVLSNNNVRQWNDKSGRNNNATSIGSQFPTYSSNSIVFTGTQAFATTLQSLIPNQSGFAVINYSGSTKMDIISVNRTSVGTAGIQQIILGGNSQILTTYGGTTIVSGSTSLVQNTRFLYNYTVNTTSSNAFMYVNGSQTGQSTGAYSFTGTGTVYIGNYGTSGSLGNEPFIGTMNEILLYSNVLTISQRQQVEGHLAWKWGLQTNLPANHPYRFNSQQALHPFTAIQTPIINVIKPYYLDFSPRSIPGCSLWLDAADATSIQFSSGANISNWRDKSGNGINAIGSNNPLYVNNVVNNLSAVRFNGISSYFTIPGNQLDIATEDFAIFSVIQHTPRVPQIPIIGKSTGQSADLQWRLSFDPNSQFQIVVFKNNNGAQSSGTYTTAGWGLFSGVVYRTANNIQGFINANTTGISSGTTSQIVGSLVAPGVPVEIGRGWSGGFFFNSDMGEILIYKGTLTVAQRQQVEGYLASKWGILGSLAPANPFRGNIRTLIYPNITISRPLVHSVARNNVRWAPTQIPGCALWLDAADSTTLFQNIAGTIPVVNGSQIQLWKDKSTNANNASNSQTVMTYNRIGLNGLPAISFPGTQTTGFSLSGALLPNGSSNASYFFVLNKNNSTVQVYFTHGGATQLKQFYAGGGLTIDRSGTPLISDATSIVNLNTIVSCTTTSLSTGVNGWRNGNAFSSTGATFLWNVNTTAAWLGSGGTAGTNFIYAGVISEVIVYNSALSTRQRQQVEGYLAYKWGLRVSLPANHPYKNIPVS